MYIYKQDNKIKL